MQLNAPVTNIGISERKREEITGYFLPAPPFPHHNHLKNLTLMKPISFKRIRH